MPKTTMQSIVIKVIKEECSGEGSNFSKCPVPPSDATLIRRYFREVKL
jgi:hypothetical protein